MGNRSNSHSSKIIPAMDIVPVTKSTTAFTGGICRALWIGTAGTLNITTQAGQERNDVPVQVGLFPVQCTHVRTGGTADDIWSIY